MELPSTIWRESPPTAVGRSGDGQARPRLVEATVAIDCDWRVTMTAGRLPRRSNDQETMRNEFRFVAEPRRAPDGRRGSPATEWPAGVIYILF